MNINKNRNKIYPSNYKPKIAFGKATISYYPMKYRDKAKTHPHLIKPKVKSFTSNLTTFVVDNEDLIPTDKMYENLIRRVWPQGSRTPKRDTQFAWVSKLEIEDYLGKVNYKFNQKEH